MADVAAHPCAVDAGVAAELPGLRLWTATVAGLRLGRTPPGVRERLRTLADRLRGAEALALRARPVPQAYRALFRQLGLDPDVTPTPLEALVLERLRRGGATTAGMPANALALALLETGVPVWALDAARVDGDLELRPARAGERLAGAPVPAGWLVAADRSGPCAVLFGPVGAPAGPGTADALLVAVQAPGVDALTVDEALWIAAEALAEQAG